MDPATAADPSTWIPLTVPQGTSTPAASLRQAARQLSTIENATLYVGGNVTLTRTRVSRQREERVDEHKHLRREVRRELGLLKPSQTYPRPDRERIATLIADKVMQRVPLGTRAPTELRLMYLEPTIGTLSGRLVDGIAFKVAAWWLDALPPLRPLTPEPGPGWYPHNPLGDTRPELDLERAPLHVSGRRLLDDLRGLSVTPLPARSIATATAGAPGCPAPPGCAPAPSRRQR
ncbi:hypothetical protein [Stenotrophomonas oahuensis]|uniref:Uncharacterized protein n=1 Tax=Stenotrophomonas oahuensis TaxID=3003271 RepID=A0ABY9YTS4_9GAMM|nr:hypothetical protein [Stenotrophomonas sp. A5586]WNH53971.1 hypothetical protein PDM29_06725 [Stenotrophomonas sp. A5586]